MMEERFEEVLNIALKKKCTDIHFNILDGQIGVYLKTIDGFQKIDSSLQDMNLFNYLQYQSHLDISSFKPQSGSFSFYFQGNYYDFRFSTMQARNTKNGVLRILNCHDGLSLEKLTFEKKIQEEFRMLLYSLPIYLLMF